MIKAVRKNDEISPGRSEGDMVLFAISRVHEEDQCNRVMVINKTL